MRLRLQIGLLGAVIVVLWAVYAALLTPKIGLLPALMLGLLGALFLLLLIASVVQTVSALRRRRLLSNAGPPRSDGFQACSGKVVALSHVAPAPLSGIDCVVWEYEFESGDGKWSGLGQVPMAIETGAGRVPIRCGVLPEELPWRKVAAAEGEERARELQDLPGRRRLHGAFAWAHALGDLERLLEDDDGGARLDLYSGAGDAPASVPKRLRERRLEEGATVTVLGRYELSERAFVPSARGVELHPCKAETLARKAFAEKLRALAFAVFTNLFLQTLVVLAFVRGEG